MFLFSFFVFLLLKKKKKKKSASCNFFFFASLLYMLGFFLWWYCRVTFLCSGEMKFSVESVESHPLFLRSFWWCGGGGFVSAGWGCSMDGEVCLLSSMCRKSEAERRMKEGSASATLAVLCWSTVPGTSSRGPRSGWSPQGMDVLILSVLYSVGIPAGALIPYVAGHGERNHLDSRDKESFSVIDPTGPFNAAITES